MSAVDLSLCAVVARVRAALGPHALRADWRRRRPADAVPSWGCCYVAAEAVYHAAGGRASGLRVMHVAHEGSPHWFLVAVDGAVVDPTADQFEAAPPYAAAKGKGFLTRGPSARARAVIAAAGFAG